MKKREERGKKRKTEIREERGNIKGKRNLKYAKNDNECKEDARGGNFGQNFHGGGRKNIVLPFFPFLYFPT
jgi:hypothetical protein